jgi:limonene-1,2-epoxide hydrolase
LNELEADHWDEALIERTLARMRPDARYHVYAWEPPLTGHAEIRAELLRQAALVGDFRTEVTTVASTDAVVLIERVDSQTVGRKKTPLTLHVAGVFEVDATGHIAAWRDYYDGKELEAQLGPGTSTAGSRT